MGQASSELTTSNVPTTATSETQSCKGKPAELLQYEGLYSAGVTGKVGPVVGPVLSFLREIDFSRLSLVLTQVGLVVVGGIFAAATGDPSGYHALAVWGFGVLLVGTWLVTFLSKKGVTSATDKEERSDSSPDARLGGAGAEAVGGPPGQDAG